MICPHCQKKLPENYGAVYCLFCGKDLPPENSVQAMPSHTLFVAAKINWRIFFLVLFAPAILSFLSLAIGLGGLAVLPGLFGGLVSGLICARMVMETIAFTGFIKFAAHFALAVVFCFLCYSLCWVGCAAALSISGNRL
jgi:hypothetical protein